MAAPVVHWFRQDLRLRDNPALSAAVESGGPVIPVYVLDEETPGRWAPGAASRWWLHQSLASLHADLKVRGSGLVLRRGAARDVLTRLVSECGATALFATRRYEPWAAALERELATAFAKDGVAFRRFGGGLLLEPEAVTTGDGRPYQVFTPFHRSCLERLPALPPGDAPDRIPAPARMPPGDRLADWQLLPERPDWAGGLRDSWSPGEEGAQARLKAFLAEAADDYQAHRDRPDLAGTSRLSPHLHFGEISPRRCWSESRSDAFRRELIWREFSHHLLHHWPDLPEAPFRERFAAFPWRDDPATLAAWQQGRTGYPIVDAGMRQLWRTGWMHNRVRMVAASFLVKHLLVPWQAGAAWFWDTLVDADLANNAASWQWVAGCGADAAPYFRIFNPMTQGRTFDPDGAYVRQWVPELADLPDRYLHEPWSAPDDQLSRSGVVLGRDYPRPIVDHRAARTRALEAFERVKR